MAERKCEVCNIGLVKSESNSGYKICEHCDKLKTSSKCWTTEYGFNCPYCGKDNYDQACAKWHTCDSCKKDFIINDMVEE